MCSRGVAAALTKCSRTPGCVTCGMADVALTMKQYVQTGLEAGRPVATTLAEPIIGGSLVFIEIGPARAGQADLRALGGGMGRPARRRPVRDLGVDVHDSVPRSPRSPGPGSHTGEMGVRGEAPRWVAE